jgi:uncharacterized protein (TIGR04255 family)
MAERFENAPLVELIAELRWMAGAIAPQGQPQPATIIFAPNQNEAFFMRFGSKIGAIGYGLIDRIVPAGFPPMPFQATYRFRKNPPEEGTTIYQIGNGVFSANITPPYHSWAQFRPVVQTGVEILIETRDPPEAATPFATATLRYVNAFGSKFTEGRSIADFARDVLGFTIDPPPVVRAEIASGVPIRHTLQMLIPLSSGQQMSLILAEGIVNNEQSVIMDISVIAQQPIVVAKDNVMEAFDKAHDIVHRVFVGSTEKLSHIMGPIREDR